MNIVSVHNESYITIGDHVNIIGIKSGSGTVHIKSIFKVVKYCNRRHVCTKADDFAVPLNKRLLIQVGQHAVCSCGYILKKYRR